MKFFTLPFISLLGFSMILSAQTEDLSFKKHPVEYVRKLGTVNMMEITDDWYPYMKNTYVIPSPGKNPSREKFNELKVIAEKQRIEKEKNPLPFQDTKSASALSAPGIGYNFSGNNYTGAVPSDNNIAVGNDGKTVSVINTNIKISGINGQFLKAASLDGFAGSVVGSDAKYDPVCAYDPVHDRYIIVFLNGYTSATSRIVVAFSQTNQPEGDWNLYAILGNASGAVWTDFPQIGLSKKELFITGNLFSNSGYAQGIAIWQVDLANGYNGDQNLTTRKFTSNNYFSLTPVEGGISAYGPHFYFVRTISTPSYSSTNVYLHKITNTIANNGSLNSPVSLVSNINYNIPPNASQMGTTIMLQTNDCRTQSAYYEGSEIRFALNTNRSGNASVYIGSIMLDTNNLSNSSVSGKAITNSVFHYAYPSVSYGGATSVNGKTSCLVFFNYTATNQYPGNAVLYLDTLDNPSTITYCKTGLSHIGSSSPFRWGDYTGAAERKNNPGEIWVAGSYGLTSNTSGTWVSQIGTQDIVTPLNVNHFVKNDAHVSVYPNPAIDMIHFEFNVSDEDIYMAEVYNMQGQLIKELIFNRLKPGKAKVSFNASVLASGLYVIYLQSVNGAPLFSRKFEVH